MDPRQEQEFELQTLTATCSRALDETKTMWKPMGLYKRVVGKGILLLFFHKLDSRDEDVMHPGNQEYSREQVCKDSVIM